MAALKMVLPTLAAAVLAQTAGAQHHESLHIEPFEGTEHFSFGLRVALSGPWALVSDPASTVPLQGGGGEVDFYLREPTGWRLTQVVRGPGSSFFGGGLAVDGDTAVVGAPLWDFFGTRTGKVYVYDRVGDHWQFTQELHPKGLAFKDRFGDALAIAGDVLAVGARGRMKGAPGYGELFVYERVGSQWTLAATFLQPREADAVKHGGLGASVAIWRDRVVASASGSEGVVYVYERSAAGWSQVAALDNPTPSVGNRFGASVATWGDTIVVGEPYDEGSGSIYLYERTPAGAWALVQQTTASDPAGQDRFGTSVSIHRDRVVVGAIGALQGAVRRGKAYVLERQSAGQWVETAQLVSTGPENEGLGSSVAIEGGFVTAGATSLSGGAAYMFEIELGKRFCPAAANSTGDRARSTVTGHPDVAREDLVLSVRDVPPGATGSFLMAAHRGPKVPVGDGWLCLGAGSRSVTPLASVGPDGAAIHAIDLGDPVLAGLLLPGSTWHFQFLFRDLAGGAAGFNASDAIAVSLE